MFLLLFVTLLFGTSAQALTWSEYRDQFIQKDPEFLQARQSLELAQAQKVEANDLNQTLLVLEPIQAKSTYEFEDSEIHRNNFYLTSRVEQKIGYGSLLTFNYRKDLEPQEIGIDRVDQEYSLGLNQALWSNAFGFADKAQAKASDLNLEAQRLEYRAARAQSCSTALELYSNAYVSQMTLQYFNLLQDEAQRAFEITKRSYNSRLVRKIDWLAAENDKLQIDSRLVQYVNAHENDWIQLQRYMDAPSPSQALEQVPLATEASAFNLSEAAQLSYQAEAAKLLSQASEQHYFARKSEERSDFNFSIEVGKREGATPTQTGVEDYNQDFVQASIRWAIPVLNSARSARIKQTYSTFLRSTEVFNELRLKEQALRGQLQQSLVALTKIYQLHVERLGSLKAQLTEAKGLLSAGRIEYQDYLIYRNQWFQELRDGLDLKKQMWLAQLQFLTLGRRESLICGGANE